MLFERLPCERAAAAAFSRALRSSSGTQTFSLDLDLLRFSRWALRSAKV